MGNSSRRRDIRSKTNGVPLPPKVSVSAAVLVALYGVPHAANAQQQSGAQSDAQSTTTLQEVVVTATRREQSLESVPYSLSVVSADELARTGVTDIASLASQVPGLSMFNLGARAAGADFPIIRGLNASPANGQFRTFEQAPVGTYIGNSPIDGYFQLDDVQRVEVLRGPQGTLYGAGALGGALRIIPNAPELDKFAGNLEVGAGTVAHSSSTSYTLSGMLNVPLGDTLAFRASGKYAYEPGFIDLYGVLKRPGPLLTASPVLANPADPVNSPGIFSGIPNWNDQNTFTGRASLLWKPTEQFNAQLAFVYAHVNGDGSPVDNPSFPGGAYPIDPRVTFPGGGNYENFAASDQPFSRRTILDSLDLSYDAGFATLSSTSSYYTTNGAQAVDGTYGLVGFPTFVGYYAGNPVNPRYVNPTEINDQAHTFSQEIRLVSNSSPDKALDYVAGLFYENQTRNGSWYIANPGTPEYSVAQGCTAPFYNLYGPGGNFIAPASFPNCKVISGPNDIYFSQLDSQHFEDKSEFGELTWHFISHGQVTFGGRHFEQSFTDTQDYNDYPFATFIPGAPRSSPASKNTWKINPSYEYATNQYVYALWSQGFRRGGANAIPLNPPSPLGEKSASLLTYQPDSTNNYETGMKGHFDNGVSYTFDVFFVQWEHPQVGGRTPIGNFAVWNAPRAVSKGAEFDLHTPLFLPGLSLIASASYADATLTEDYLIPADVYGNIVGKAGQQLPGSPKTSAAATLNYQHQLLPGYDLNLSLNDTYRSAMFLSTFPLIGQTTGQSVSGMNIANASASVMHRSLRVGVYVTNLTNKLTVQVPPAQVNEVGNLTDQYTINPPREVDIRFGYSF